ncbi:MAG: CRISPR-associated endonuclease Cas2 [Alphaproteobacteria bacterium]|nr:CRISPR-associated endonuclease Cas2 [Alphaproteobacteria bacterium]
MRIMVFFDLPTMSKIDRKHATKFRNALLREGYYMMQWSIYSRICKGVADVEKHSRRLKSLIPPTGSVRLMSVTERQFADMEILVGESPKTEKIGAQQLLLL